MASTTARWRPPAAPPGGYFDPHAALADGVAVPVTFTAGVAAASVPAMVKAAIKLLAAHWFEHREAVADGGVQAAPVPLAFDSILYSARSYRF